MLFQEKKKKNPCTLCSSDVLFNRAHRCNGKSAGCTNSYNFRPCKRILDTHAFSLSLFPFCIPCLYFSSYYNYRFLSCHCMQMTGIPAHTCIVQYRIVYTILYTACVHVGQTGSTGVPNGRSIF